MRRLIEHGAEVCVCARMCVCLFWCWDLLLVRSCIDAICHCRLGPVSADPPLAPPPPPLSPLEWRQADWRGVNTTALLPAAPPTYSNPIFLPPASVLLLAHNPICSARPSASTVAKELKRRRRPARETEQEKREERSQDRVWGNEGTVGGERLSK